MAFILILKCFKFLLLMAELIDEYDEKLYWGLCSAEDKCNEIWLYKLMIVIVLCSSTSLYILVIQNIPDWWDRNLINKWSTCLFPVSVSSERSVARAVEFCLTFKGMNKTKHLFNVSLSFIQIERNLNTFIVFSNASIVTEQSSFKSGNQMRLYSPVRS